MCADSQSDQPVPREGYIPVGNASLFYRDIGRGRPIFLLHGGPDFDHTYLLPEMDRLSDTYRLIYYDQRGRGKSMAGVQPDDVTIQSEIEDLESLRTYLGLDSVAVLGHSWGGVLAMEYSIRHPDRVSHMILMNTAAASHEDYLVLRQEVRRRKAVYQGQLNALISGAAYKEGDPEAVTAYYRIHFSAAFKRAEHLDRLMERMRVSFTKESVLKGRAIEERLYSETWSSPDYDLFPELARLDIPTLVIHGDYDFIPAPIAAHIAQTIPGSRYVLLPDCGHFSYIESPDDVRRELAVFFAGES